MVVEGVDYSFQRPKPQALKNAGKHFAVRYGGEGSESKWLTRAELNALRAVGIDVVANVEGSAGGYTGAAAGRKWAASGDAHFRALGMPADRPIYFSVDFDAGVSHWSGIDAALRASAGVIGADRVGVYGSYDVIEHCRVADTARWFWQTYAWSGGKHHGAAHLYQYKNGVTIGGGDCDLTRALTDDYGQWEFDMPLTGADVQLFLDYDPNTKGKGIPNPFSDKATNPTISVGTALYNAVLISKQAHDAVNGLATQVRQLKEQVAALPAPTPPADVDEVALAAQLAPLLEGVEAAAIEQALRTVLRGI